MKNLEEPRIKYISHKAKGVYANILLELPNCGRAQMPEATVLDNLCFSMHNMQFQEERQRICGRKSLNYCLMRQILLHLLPRTESNTNTL